MREISLGATFRLLDLLLEQHRFATAVTSEDKRALYHIYRHVETLLRARIYRYLARGVMSKLQKQLFFSPLEED